MLFCEQNGDITKTVNGHIDDTHDVANQGSLKGNSFARVAVNDNQTEDTLAEGGRNQQTAITVDLDFEVLTYVRERFKVLNDRDL